MVGFVLRSKGFLCGPIIYRIYSPTCNMREFKLMVLIYVICSIGNKRVFATFQFGKLIE